jgi:N-acetylglutamate synthase-like GNAT family acetyltransferase
MRTETEEHFVSTDAALLDVDFIHAVLNRTYWAQGRSREVVQESIRNSICFGLYEKASQRQVGFARIVTDKVTFSWLCDVVVDEKCRRKGLGKFLMSCVVAHPVVSGTLCMLGTSDAHGLYEKYGFRRSEQMKRPRNQGEPNKSADSMTSVGAPSAAVTCPSVAKWN